MSDFQDNHIYKYGLDSFDVSSAEKSNMIQFKKDASAELQGAIVFFLIFLIFEFVSLLVGMPVMFLQITFLSTFMHLLGCLFTGWFLLDSWQYKRIWYIWILFGLFPFVLELTLVGFAIRFKVMQSSNQSGKDLYFA